MDPSLLVGDDPLEGYPSKVLIGLSEGYEYVVGKFYQFCSREVRQVGRVNVV